ncbi:sensor histidine kinase [hot springs metagenome]|uniref:histidine kinase n=1 Tax=hot springs metagenome TaxID=433727 RepID=A0A5J4KS00_9ZZZZ
MKTKIFLAFIVVILLVLFSNFIFEWLIIKDFDNYVNGVKEDQFYWILASVEGSYSDGKWDIKALSESIHWAMMFGLDIKILNANGHEIISSREVMESLSDTMKHRMKSLFHTHITEGKYEEYPLYIKDKNIGKLLSRPFEKDVIKEKEAVFRMRSKNFIIVSFLIAGVGSLIVALFFSQYLSKPLTDLKTAAENIAKGHLDVKITPKTSDEVGKLSESFNIMAESLRKEEELRRHLMSNIAHELRTPLTILKSYIEAIEDGVTETGKGLENIKDELNRLIRLIKGIEDITTAEASFFVKGEMVEVNLREFLLEISEEVRPAFKEKGLDINIAKEDDLIIVTDIEKLEKIIRNIVSNSLKFTEKGGVWIDYGTEENNFYIEIRDSGRGIPENKMPHIFERFYRIEGSRTNGLGLGLAIVKELVNVMDGMINVQSEVNKGTVFRIYLPKGA